MLIFLANTGYTIKFEKLTEGIFTEKFPNSNKTMIFDRDLLFSVNERSLSIFKISNNQFIRLSDLNLVGQLHSLDIYKNAAFVSTSTPVNSIYKIDISKVSEPVVIDTLVIKGSYTGFIFQDKYCVNELFQNKDWVLHFYDIKDFRELSAVKVPHNKWPVEKLTDKLLTIISNEFIELYTCQDYELLLVAKQQVKDLSYPRETFMLNDSIFIHSCDIKGFSVFNISNPYSWDLISNIRLSISNFQIEDNRLIVLERAHEIKYYDISELSKPVLTDSITIEEKTRDLCFKGNNIFVCCMQGNLYHFKLSKSDISLLSEYSGFGYIKDAIFYDHNLIANTALGYTIQAQMIDGKITILNKNKDDLRNRYLQNFEDHFLKYSLYENSDVSITDIGQIKPHNISYLIKGIMNLPDNAAVFENNLIYLGQGYIRIFKISDNIKLALEMEFTEFERGRFFFNDGYIFLIGFEKGVVLKYDQTNTTLKIVGDFDLYYNTFSNAAFYKNYMIVSPELGGRTTEVYDISDLNNIEETVIIPHKGKLSVDKDNGILFMGDYKCKMYDINNIENNVVKYLTEIKNKSAIIKLFNSYSQNKNLLWLVGETSVSLFSYSLN